MTNALTFTRADETIEVTTADGTAIAIIEIIPVTCWDGRERVADYYTEMLIDGTEESEDSFPVRNGGNTKTYEGITAKGQLAAAKSWIREQYATVA